ncbi:hypothetical protein IT570_14570 [Candidatus Sumerlaeota bacterium]|nr:hypothetical protein [Candidatus Sumerlaeota bacterium]
MQIERDAFAKERFQGAILGAKGNSLPYREAAANSLPMKIRLATVGAPPHQGSMSSAPTAIAPPPSSWGANLLLLLLVFALFGPVFTTGLFQDDFPMLVYFPDRPITHVSDWLPRAFALEKPWKPVAIQDYRPVGQEIFFSIANYLFGRSLWLYRLAGLLMFGAVITLLRSTLVVLGAGMNVAFLAAFFYATRVAAVLELAWVTALQELVMLIFAMAALRVTAALIAGFGNSAINGVASFGFFVAAALSKETAWVIPAIISLVVALRWRDMPARRRTGSILLVVAMCAVAAMLIAIKFMQPAFRDRVSYSFGDWITLSLRNVVAYMAFTFEANREIFRLIADRQAPPFSLALVLYAICLPLSWCCYMWIARRGFVVARTRLGVMGLSWFVIAYIPVLAAPANAYGYYLSLAYCGLALFFGVVAERALASAPQRTTNAVLMIMFLTALGSFHFERTCPEGYHQRAILTRQQGEELAKFWREGGSPQVLVLRDFTQREYWSLGWGWAVNWYANAPAGKLKVYMLPQQQSIHVAVDSTARSMTIARSQLSRASVE